MHEFSGNIDCLPVVDAYLVLPELIGREAIIKIHDAGIGPYEYGSEKGVHRDLRARLLPGYAYFVVYLNFQDEALPDNFHGNIHKIISAPISVDATAEIKDDFGSTVFNVKFTATLTSLFRHESGKYIVRYDWDEKEN